MKDDQGEILTVNEFATLVEINPATVRRMIRNGRLNAFKIGSGGKTSGYRIARSEIARLSLIVLRDVIEYLVETRRKV